MKKFFRYIFVITQMICICLLCSCNKTNDNDKLISEKMDELSTAIDNYNNSKNFTVQSGKIYTQKVYKNDVLIDTVTSSQGLDYSENLDIQNVRMKFDSFFEYYISEYVDGDYVTYLTNQWGNNKQKISHYTYAKLRSLCTNEIELEVDDFTYDAETSKYIGDKISIANKIKESTKDYMYYTDFEVVKFEIALLNGYFYTFEIEYEYTSTSKYPEHRNIVEKCKYIIVSNFEFND